MNSKSISWAYRNWPERDRFVVIVVALVIGYHAITTLLAWRRLRHIPGPPLASISNLWGFYTVASGQTHIKFPNAQKRYGKVMRVGPDAIMVYDPETLWRINSARSAYGRGGWYKSIRFHPEGESVFSELNTSLHDKRKANLVAGFAGNNLANLERDVDSQIATFVQYIRRRVLDQGNNRLDFSKGLRWFQMDLVSLVTLGKAWGDLDDETDHFDFLRSMDMTIPAVHSISVMPVLREIAFSKLSLYLAVKSGLFDKLMGSSIRELKSSINYHFENANEAEPGRKRGSVLVSEFLRDSTLSKMCCLVDACTKDSWIKNGHSPAQCESDLLIAFPAGSETTITAIRGTFLHILSSPAIYQKLKQEISDGIKSGRISRPITNQQAKEMPYLQAVINEGMRVVPPLISGFSKSVPPGGDTICGSFVPEGTEVHMNFISMLMNPDVFGADAQVFRPERFLECDDKQKSMMLKTIDLCFGYGRWVCLGRSLARLELNKIYVELLRAFDFQIDRPGQPWKLTGYTSFLIEDFELRVWENALD